jgi:hypothetical protein
VRSTLNSQAELAAGLGVDDLDAETRGDLDLDRDAHRVAGRIQHRAGASRRAPGRRRVARVREVREQVVEQSGSLVLHGRAQLEAGRHLLAAARAAEVEDPRVDALGVRGLPRGEPEVGDRELVLAVPVEAAAGGEERRADPRDGAVRGRRGLSLRARTMIVAG